MPYSQLKKVKKIVDRALTPYTRLLEWMGVKPNHLTLLSLPTGVAGALLLFDKPIIAFTLIAVYFTCDFTDGMLARHTGNETGFGDKLDYNIDRLIATVFLANLYFKTEITLLPVAGVTLIALITLEDAGIFQPKNLRKWTKNYTPGGER